MIKEDELKEAIAECEGARNPSATTCMKLAAFYTIRDHMHNQQDGPRVSHRRAKTPTYSYDAGDEIDLEGKDREELIEIFEEVLETLKTIHPRLYAATMDRIAGL